MGRNYSPKIVRVMLLPLLGILISCYIQSDHEVININSSSAPPFLTPSSAEMSLFSRQEVKEKFLMRPFGSEER